MNQRRPNLIRAIESGRSVAGHLQDRSDQTQLSSTGQIADAVDALARAEAKTATAHPLWVREWAASSARAVLKMMPDEHDPAVIRRAEALMSHLSALDERDFAEPHEALRTGRYTPQAYLDDLDRMNPAEWDAFTQRLLMVNAVPERTTPKLPGMVHYLPSPTRSIRRIAARLTPNDVFCDIGSGLGLVVMLVSWLSGAKGMGIEIEPVYTETARRLNEELQISDARFVTGNAVDADQVKLDQVSAMYFYDTFRGPLLETFIDRMRTTHRRPLSVISRGQSNPVFAAQDWLTVVDRSPEDDLLFLASTKGPK